jgi:hypothetical protein
MSLKRFTVFESLFLATDQKIPTINKRKALFSQKLSREQVQDKYYAIIILFSCTNVADIFQKRVLLPNQSNLDDEGGNLKKQDKSCYIK